MRSLVSSNAPTSPPPWGLRWRSSVWFVTLVVGFGVATDLFAYAVIIPVVPFRLESLGYADASARTGWLLFAYSGGLAVSTPPIAWFSEHYNVRRMPLLIGLLALIGSQIMFMLAPVYWLMALARIIQGVSSTCVWTVGLALLCDTIPESRVGQQLGLAMTGLSAGVVIAPPVGGALFQKLGFHAPFIFSIGIAFFDLLGRMLVIERKHAILWGVDPREEGLTLDPENINGKNLAEKVPKTLTSSPGTPAGSTDLAEPVTPEVGVPNHHHSSQLQSPANGSTALTRGQQMSDSLPGLGSQLTVIERKNVTEFGESPQPSFSTTLRGSSTVDPVESQQSKMVAKVLSTQTLVETSAYGDGAPRLTSMQVLSALFHSSRALAALINTLIYGISYSAQEPTLPLRLQKPYGLSALKVGLIYIASSVPTLLSGPVAGWLADRKGPGIVTITSLMLAIPWVIVMAIHGPLALIIIANVVSNFFIAAVVAPLTAELAAVTRSLPGVGYSHVYGAFNLAYGIGSALGPIIGGQLYDRVTHGWTAVIGMVAGMILVAAIIAFVYAGETPVVGQILRKWTRRRVSGTAVAAKEGKEGLNIIG